MTVIRSTARLVAITAILAGTSAFAAPRAQSPSTPPAPPPSTPPAEAPPALPATRPARPDFRAISRSLPALPATESGWSLPLHGRDPMRWNAIRSGVEVCSTVLGEDEATAQLSVTYTRAPRTANGVAIVVPHGSFETIDSLVIRASATPDQRLFVSLTDGEGFVWSFPTIRLGAESDSATLRIADLKPDQFQNQGKTIPAEVDLTTITMLSIVDVSGYMNAPEDECAWTIDAIEGVRR